MCPQRVHKRYVRDRMWRFKGSYIARWIAPIQPDLYLTFLTIRSSASVAQVFRQRPQPRQSTTQPQQTQTLGVSNCPSERRLAKSFHGAIPAMRGWYQSTTTCAIYYNRFSNFVGAVGPLINPFFGFLNRHNIFYFGKSSMPDISHPHTTTKKICQNERHFLGVEKAKLLWYDLWPEQVNRLLVFNLTLAVSFVLFLIRKFAVLRVWQSSRMPH